MSNELRSYQDRLGYRLLIASAMGVVLFHLLPSFASRVHSEAPLTTAYGWEIWTILPSEIAKIASGDIQQILQTTALLLLFLAYFLLTIGCCLAIKPLRKSRLLRGLALFLSTGVNLISFLATYQMAEGARVEGDDFQILGYWLLPISLALSLFGLLLIKPPRPTPPLES